MKKIIVIALALLLLNGYFAEAAMRKTTAVSPDKSIIFPRNQVVNSSDENALIGVELFDELGNPVRGHRVKLIASSENVSMRALAAVTDAAGKTLFEVSADEPGVVSYAAYDVTADVLLRERAKVVYFDSISLARGSPAGAVAKLKFDEADEDIDSGDSVTFTLKALDDKDQTVVDYAGKVRFSVEGDNTDFVELPADYQFTVSDQGAHTFSLALSFLKDGIYRVNATDLADFELEGSYIFDVKPAATAAASGSGIVITNPTAGTYSTSSMAISGRATPGDKLKIVDNELEIAKVQADLNGEFSYTTSALAEGEHRIYVASVNEIGTVVEVSATVNIVIDTAAPEISKVELDPAGPVNPNDPVGIKLFVSEELEKAKVDIGGNIYELMKTANGYYGATITAPIEFGEYKLDFILIDGLGNEARVEDQASLKVGVFDTGAGVVPGDIPNLTAKAGNGRVTLQWGPAKINVNPISHYRVFYGTSPGRLTEAVDTLTNATTWYVSGLANGTEYYFGVAAVDSRGGVSKNFLTIVSAVPNGTVSNVQTPVVFNGVEGKDAISGMKSDVSDTGPEIWWLVGLSLLGGIFYGRMRAWIRPR